MCVCGYTQTLNTRLNNLQFYSFESHVFVMGIGAVAANRDASGVKGKSAASHSILILGALHQQVVVFVAA